MKKLLFLSSIATFAALNLNAHTHFGFGFNIQTEEYCPVIARRPIIQPMFRPVYRPVIINTVEIPVFDEPIFVERPRPVVYSDDYCDIEDLEEAQMARLAKKSAKRHEQKVAMQKEISRQEVERKVRKEKEIQQKIAHQKAILEQASENIESLEAELDKISK